MFLFGERFFMHTVIAGFNHVSPITLTGKTWLKTVRIAYSWNTRYEA
jgi:hypothetical protein